MPTDDLPLWDAPETAEFWPAGYDRIILDETDSTMAEARRRAPDLSGPTWIMAHNQTGAHGRRGRPWSMPTGNFAATLFLRPEGTAAEAALRSFTAALAVHQTLAMNVAPDILSLKWPNDVLLRGGKVAGILLESEGQADRVSWLTIGIGVNLAAAPKVDQVEDGAVRPVSVSDEGAQGMSCQDFLFWLANHFATLEQMHNEFGFDPIRRLWLRNAARLGEQITARTMRDEITGTFETIDETGQLVLQTPKGQVAIAAGDVFF